MIYKKVSELGLEVIELEDQVLLVDPNEPCQEDDWIYWNKRVIKAIDTTYSKDSKYIVTSTKQLERLPLLVIEDEVKKLSFEEFPISIDTRNNITRDTNSLSRDPFIKGYNKAKETYKFTEDDLRKVLELGLTLIDGNIHNEKHFQALIQSLTKKELWIEVEELCTVCDNNQDKSNRCKQIRGEVSICCIQLDSKIKITNNQIKGIW